jgi:clan AA aspartic protease (TIGR02281 family)
VPLKSPHSDFRRTQKLALEGNPAEERTLGAYYDSGYLVSRCRERAAYWYGRAAHHGDTVALAWIKKHSTITELRNGGECFGDSCFASPKKGVLERTVLQRGFNGGYSASVMINGRTTRGVIDTGATFVAMSATAAREFGIAYSSGRQLQMRTANGLSTARAVTLDAVTVGNITLNAVEAVVSDGEHPLLIGMSFLGRLTINTDGNGMTLIKP